MGAGAAGAPDRDESPVRLADFELPRDRLLYHGQPQRDYEHGWLASNEADWGRGEVDRRPADTFVGFGNNTVWDLAMRRGARTMVIADADEGVIKAQEFFYRPLITVARSRQEFVAMLGGVPLPARLADAPIDEVFDHVEAERERIATDPGREGDAARRAAARFIDGIAERIREQPGLGPRYARLVEFHLRWSLVPQRSYSPLPGLIPPSIHPAYAGQGFSEYGQQENIFEHFAERYRSDRVIGWGGDPERAADPSFSVLSSPESFAWLKRAFSSGEVYYAVGDIRDARLYASVGRFLRHHDKRVSGLSVNNIPDFAAHEHRGGDEVATAIRRLVGKHLPIDARFSMYRTIGLMPPHDYVREAAAARARAPRSATVRRRSAARARKRTTGTTARAPRQAKGR